MSRPLVTIYDADGSFVTREMNDEEHAQWQKDKAQAKALKDEADAKEAQRQAILDRLGLTADEAKLLLG
ncbi:hypothetical protein UFOVP865_10 [uncultured Caudovirales phage]|uniref:Uncharacterized protein n=1 Tax=uncultured Caudovirales phage TaxID=2100421 RepID=A0A6J5P608_9CAUD|nr:hypothetical protein UFOVP865_10 [uncultured Caudovirales phage]